MQQTTKQIQMFEADIQCLKCSNKQFKLRYVKVDDILSVIVHCNCGKAVEYRGIQCVIPLCSARTNEAD